MNNASARRTKFRTWLWWPVCFAVVTVFGNVESADAQRFGSDTASLEPDAAESAEALEVEFRPKRPGTRMSQATLSTEIVRGEVVLRAADGGVMLRTDMGEIAIIQPEQIKRRDAIDPSTLVLPSREIARRLREDLGRLFQIHATANYVVAYDGNVNHAKRVAMLLEQLHRGFFSFWSNQKIKVTPPAGAMQVLVLRDRQSFDRYAAAEIGPMADHLIGYYHLETNRMITYAVANFERNVATVIHEATHQLAYNCGLQNRVSDNPLWMSEGLAMFFESPDMRNRRRWTGIGRVNAVNLGRFRRYSLRRPIDSLTTLIATDDRFRNAASAEAAYGESWALTYFLIRTRREDYYRYLDKIGSLPPVIKRTPTERLEDFVECFGDLSDLDRDFVTYMKTVRSD